MGALEVDVDALRQGADQLEKAKESVRQVADAFQSAVDAAGDPFGGDTIGMLCGIAHAAVVSAVGECFDSNIEELESDVEKIRKMADSHEQNEQDIAKSFEGFGPT